ncbi:MAG: hypothetical protein ACOCQ1_04825 [Halanaerobiaceae bacterium]
MSRKIKCESCGALNFSGDVYCRKCNGALFERNVVNDKKASYLYNKGELASELENPITL